MFSVFKHVHVSFLLFIYKGKRVAFLNLAIWRKAPIFDSRSSFHLKNVSLCWISYFYWIVRVLPRSNKT